MNVWYTSDLHFGHRMVAGLRGYTHVEDHDLAIMDAWNVVQPGDLVFVLGDLAVSNPDAALEMIGCLPGNKHLIAGNHDACHPMYRRAYREQARYLKVFDSVQAFARRVVNGVDVLMSHFPYVMDHTADARFMQYRLRDEGTWLLHGHTHGKERAHGHEVHVGLDAWGMRLVPEGTIARIVSEDRPAAFIHCGAS